jgi:hypothetical protein
MPASKGDENRMTRLYDKAQALVDFRREKAEEAGLGFELPANGLGLLAPSGDNGDKAMTASA